VKTRLLLVRHGQSEGNRRKIFLGHTDLSLSALGKAQAKAAAEYLSAFPPAAIYSSDLRRAVETAEPTAALHGLPIQTRRALREIDCGLWSGKPYDVIRETHKESWESFLKPLDPHLIRCAGGESVAEMAERFSREILRLGAQHEGKTVFVFTHATVIRALALRCGYRSYFCDVPGPTNASVSEFIYENNTLTLKEYGRDGHMEGISSGSHLE